MNKKVPLAVLIVIGTVAILGMLLLVVQQASTARIESRTGRSGTTPATPATPAEPAPERGQTASPATPATPAEPDGGQAEAQQPSVTVISPNGSETWIKGQTAEIWWSSHHTGGGFDATVTLRRVGGDTVATIAAETANDGEESWRVPADIPDGNTYEVAVNVCNRSALHCVSDTSDNPFRIVSPPPVITTTSLPIGTVGVPYSATLAVKDGLPPYAWSLLSSALPAGLKLIPSTGIIGGIPTTAGKASFTVQVTDANELSDDQTLALEVRGGTTYEGPFTLRGRLVDRFSNSPVPAASVFAVKGTTRLTSVTTDERGQFALSLHTRDVTGSSSSYIAVFITKRCFMSLGNGFRVARYSAGTLLSGGTRVTTSGVWVDGDAFDYIRTESHLPVAGPTVNVGDFPLWPSADFSLSSDVPVKFTIPYDGEGRGAGNINYRTSHYLSSAIPLNHDTRAILTDQSGKSVTSPTTHPPLAHGCGPVNLRFSGGEATWE